MTSQHAASESFSPLFSNAAADHHSQVHHVNDPTAEQKRSTQKRSEPNGDHHLTFVDLADSAHLGW